MAIPAPSDSKRIKSNERLSPKELMDFIRHKKLAGEFTAWKFSEDRESVPEERGCRESIAKGAYTFICGDYSNSGNIQLCKNCQEDRQSVIDGCGKDFYFRENPRQKMICGTDYLCYECQNQDGVENAK